MRGLVLCVLVTGCGFSPTASPRTVDGPASDVPTDQPSGTFDGAPICYGAGMETVCLDAAPTAPYPGGSLAVLTDVGAPLCRTDVTTPADNSLCVVAFTDVMLTATISGHGARPLVVIAADTFTIASNGVIDVASRNTTPPTLGAAANGTCHAATTSAGHGGGAGGSFNGTGGSGGSPGGPAGMPGAPVALTSLRGGCPGLDGTGSTASHGDGGGAVVLIASTLEVDGQIDASGDGGHGGVGNGFGGGGGGGSGGLVAIVATTLSGNGQIYTAGAGGAEGGEDDSGTFVAGATGTDPSTSTIGGGASGGGGNTENGGNGGGGNASAGVNGGNGQTGSGVSFQAGGGGGGGGAGYLLLHVGTNSFTGPGAYSPQPTNV